ncbi:Speckle-type POZ protein-like protein B [Hordeum vulgare]|nr:Speckle-type POZ protein-like protein B [Hordeum vulgare]
MPDSSSTSLEITWRCVTAWEQTRTFNFEVTDYLRLAGMGVGEYVSWPDVEVGRSKWKIKFYPDEVDDDCDGTPQRLCAGTATKKAWIRIGR